jgi:hypothetical protein
VFQKILDELGKNVGNIDREMLQNDVTFCKMLHKQRKMSHLGFYFASLVDFLRQNFATLTDYRFFFGYLQIIVAT